MAVRRGAIMLTIWKSLGLTDRAFCLVLLLTSIYCLFSATKAMLRLHSLRRLNPAKDLASIQGAVTGVRDLMGNVRQVIDATFYLFGIVLFANLQTIGYVIDNSKIPTDYYILRNFLFDCSLAESGFVVFFVLHLLQWCVIRRANACLKRLNA